jgi:hypothetical protein
LLLNTDQCHKQLHALNKIIIMKTISKLLFVMLTTSALLSCEKPEGEGGRASIRGSVWTEDWNSTFTVMSAEYPSADKEVYIIYGNDITYSQRIRANYNGEYEFKYLREGNYKIYVYSKDKTLQSPSGETAIVKDVSISKKKQTVIVDRITIYN